MKKIIFLTIFFMINSLQASEVSTDTMENNLIVRAGLSVLSVFFKTGSLIDNHESDDDDKFDDDYDETKTVGVGFSTSVAKRWTNFELGFGSDVYFGLIKDLTFSADNHNIRGSGNFRVINLGPTIKYHTPWTIFNLATVYVGGGPNWSLQTFVFTDVKESNGFNDDTRVSFENYGGNVFFGIEQIKVYKSEHPAFLEFGYSYMNSYEVSINDASKETDVITLNETNSRKFSGHYFIVRLGFTLF